MRGVVMLCLSLGVAASAVTAGDPLTPKQTCAIESRESDAPELPCKAPAETESVHGSDEAIGPPAQLLVDRSAIGHAPERGRSVAPPHVHEREHREHRVPLHKPPSA